MGEPDCRIAFNGGMDEERGQYYARTLWNKIEASVSPGKKLPNHRVLEKVLEEIQK